MSEKIVGVIGGSGLYELEGLENVKEEEISTPFGDPSDAYIVGELGGVAARGEVSCDEGLGPLSREGQIDIDDRDQRQERADDQGPLLPERGSAVGGTGGCRRVR